MLITALYHAEYYTLCGSDMYETFAAGESGDDIVLRESVWHWTRRGCQRYASDI
jgi:hypothetical protein